MKILVKNIYFHSRSKFTNIVNGIISVLSILLSYLAFTRWTDNTMVTNLGEIACSGGEYRV